MTHDIDEMLEASDTMGTEGPKGYKTYQKACLNQEKKMMRVKFIGGFKEFFEAWPLQQNVPGVKPESIGKPRRIIVKGFSKTNEGYVYNDPYTKLMNSWMKSEDISKKE